MPERFRAHIVVNVLCTVSLMSTFLTVIGTWIGSRGRRGGLIAQQVAPSAPECYTVLTLPITKGVVFVQKHLTVVHFSPTGGTRRAALLLAEGLAERIDELDLTLPAPTGRAFGPQDAVLFAGLRRPAARPHDAAAQTLYRRRYAGRHRRRLWQPCL